MKDLDAYGTPEELFAPGEGETGAEEKIDTPAYSYWRSVWRVFFGQKINFLLRSLPDGGQIRF